MMTVGGELLRHEAAMALASVRERNGGVPYVAWDAVYGVRGAKTLRDMLFEEVDAVLDVIRPGWRDIE